MDAMATVTDKNFDTTKALIEYNGRDLIVFTTSKWVKIFFGLLGDTLAPVKERYRISVSEIETVILREDKSKATFELFLNDGRIYEIIFNINEPMALQLRIDLDKKVIVK